MPDKAGDIRIVFNHKNVWLHDDIVAVANVCNLVSGSKEKKVYAFATCTRGTPDPTNAMGKRMTNTAPPSGLLWQVICPL
jgi:hypothetical protein